MNKIVVHLSAATLGAAVLSGAVMFGISQQTEIDLLRAAALRSAAREAEHNEQLRTALGIGEQVQSLAWQTSGISRDVSAAKNTTQDLLKMAQEAKSRRSSVKPEPVIRRIQPPPPPPPEALEPQKPAAPAPEVKPQAVAVAGIKVDADAMLAAHNRLRTEVGVPGLAWSEKLAKVAQDWADHLAADDKCSIYHSETKYGENVYIAGAVSYSSGRRAMQPISAMRPVQMWGAEKEGYYAATGECSAPDGCGHYTQVVWKDTTEVGCGMAVCGNKAQIWVCNYFPAGNMAGRKPF
jgi:pathogenesis-related protein 1